MLEQQVGEVIFDQRLEAAAKTQGHDDVGNNDGGVDGKRRRLCPAVDELVEQIEGFEMDRVGELQAQGFDLTALQVGITALLRGRRRRQHRRRHQHRNDREHDPTLHRSHRQPPA